MIHKYGRMKGSHPGKREILPESALFSKTTPSTVLSPFKCLRRGKPGRQVSHPVWEDDFLPSRFPLAPFPSVIVSRAGAGGRHHPKGQLCSSLPLVNGPHRLPCVARAHSSGTSCSQPQLKRPFIHLLSLHQNLKREETSKYEGQA